MKERVFCVRIVCVLTEKETVVVLEEFFLNTAVTPSLQLFLSTTTANGKVMSSGANKLQMLFLPNSIYSKDPISKMQ